MYRFITQVVFALLAFTTIIHLVAGQTVSPFATHDCSSQVVYTGDHACNNDVTKCCAATGQCCAGGCCPYDAYCVFVGTANEACCSLSDNTQCGEAPPVSGSIVLVNRLCYPTYQPDKSQPSWIGYISCVNFSWDIPANKHAAINEDMPRFISSKRSLFRCWFELVLCASLHLQRQCRERL